MTTTKTVEEDLATRIASIDAQLEEAFAAEATAGDASSTASGLLVLNEISKEDADLAAEALAEAKRHVSALLSAQKVLTGREAAQTAQKEQARVDRLRTESEGAAAAQNKALDQVSRLGEQLSIALASVRSNGATLDALHGQLGVWDPERAAEVEQDRRDALAMLARTFEQKRAAIREASASAQYQLQAPSDGTDRAVEKDVLLLGEVVVIVGASFAAGRSAVGMWELSALSALDQEIREAQAEAWQEHAARVETAGLGNLSASLQEVRAAADLDAGTVALLLDDETARALAGLTNFLPASSNSGIGFRNEPKSALEARQAEASLQNGVQAIRTLIGHS